MWIWHLRKSRDSTEEAGTEETDALLDLLTCPHSPWRLDEPGAPRPRPSDSWLCSNMNTCTQTSSTTTLLHFALWTTEPQLVCMDLSHCEFQDQQALLRAVSTLPCLRTLVLEGNPFTLAPSYPGFTLDTFLPGRLMDPLRKDFALEAWPRRVVSLRAVISRSESSEYLIVDRASATVSVGRMRGIPDPLMSEDGNTPDFPVIAYSYFITYDFLSHQTVNLNNDSDSKFDAAHITEDCFSSSGLQSNKSCEKESSKPDTQALTVFTEETCHDIAHVTRHSTTKLTWSDCIDFSNTKTHVMSDLGGLKRFFNQGLYLTIVEEKVLSWPAASEDVPGPKPCRTVKEKKGGKGKESPIKSGSTKDKSKDKKKKSVPELVQDASIQRTLGSVHVPLQSLVQRGGKVDVLCDFGALHAETEDLGKKLKEDKKKEKEPKRRADSGTKQKNTAASKGKVKETKDCEMEVHLEPVTVELKVELEKWQSASEAHHLLLPHQHS
ncbi:hypothetical protein F7725_012893 [Dissostichus mawsoni]|uniref:Leucine-rich repeat-containing protein 43 n=1 Tax=Dissostichus mawsoni TaxID=36200 RepID=A0A7J5YQ95_DISMA|nr:hypothetical protein F7725_012893 [Dissostichus mawsoni]